MNSVIVPLVAVLGLSLALGAAARPLGARFRFQTATGVPAAGGISILLAWWAGVLLFGGLPGGAWPAAGLSLASAIIVLVGLADLRRALGPFPQLLGQGAAALVAAVLGGVSAQYVTHPGGGLLYLNHWDVGGVVLPGAALTVLWMVILMNAVNFLDGVDGLAAAVSTIGFLVIGLTSLLPQVREPAVALPAFLAAAATAGFLFWNFPPARLTLGTPGSWFLGFLLAALSVQGSSKIATLAVVGAIPLLDAVSVVLRRLCRGASPFHGDTTHLHHRLTARGWSPRGLLAAYAGASALLGFAAVYLPTAAKVLLLGLTGLASVLRTWRSGRSGTPHR